MRSEATDTDPCPAIPASLPRRAPSAPAPTSGCGRRAAAELSPPPRVQGEAETTTRREEGAQNKGNVCVTSHRRKKNSSPQTSPSAPPPTHPPTMLRSQCGKVSGSPPPPVSDNKVSTVIKTHTRPHTHPPHQLRRRKILTQPAAPGLQGQVAQPLLLHRQSHSSSTTSATMLTHPPSQANSQKLPPPPPGHHPPPPTIKKKKHSLTTTPPQEVSANMPAKSKPIKNHSPQATTKKKRIKPCHFTSAERTEDDQCVKRRTILHHRTIKEESQPPNSSTRGNPLPDAANPASTHPAMLTMLLLPAPRSKPCSPHLPQPHTLSRRSHHQTTRSSGRRSDHSGASKPPPPQKKLLLKVKSSHHTHTTPSKKKKKKRRKHQGSPCQGKGG